MPDEIKDQFEIQSLKRCSKCCDDVKTYAVKVASAKEMEAQELKESARMVEIIQTLKER